MRKDSRGREKSEVQDDQNEARAELSKLPGGGGKKLQASVSKWL